jgi:hypothetical protein
MNTSDIGWTIDQNGSSGRTWSGSISGRVLNSMKKGAGRLLALLQAFMMLAADGDVDRDATTSSGKGCEDEGQK